MELVQMVHDDVPESKDNPPTVTRKAFDQVWSKNGWKLFKPKTNSKEK